MKAIYGIPGGIHPPEEKALSQPGKLRDNPLPNRLVLPLSQHIGAPARVIVAEGDRVLGGQLLAESQGNISAALHAPTSGTVSAISRHQVPDPSGKESPCVIIDCDGQDDWLELQGHPDWREIDGAALISIISDAGIAGLGGAGFPTAGKLIAGTRTAIKTLIVNGTECEPYITADDTIMRLEAPGVVEGAEILAHILGAEEILFGVEDNKPEAAQAMEDAVTASSSHYERGVLTFPTKYPSGGEKQLIQILTGKEVPSGGLPADVGIVCQNPGTLVAVRDAVIDGKPLTDRIVTVTGRALAAPGNYRARLGTPVSHLLALSGVDSKAHERLIHGGPMMGFALDSVDVPIIKTTNCLLAPTPEELPLPAAAQPCIRCGLCAEACPASLLPQQLYWYARSRDHEQLERHHLFDCIECGACSWVCPSSIPLVQYYRASKGAIREARVDKARSDQSKQRFEARQERVAREAAEREAKRAARKAAAAKNAKAAGDEDPVQAAIARAKAKKAAQESAADAASNTEPESPS